MLYVRARLRYLAALGLPALALPMFACSAGGTTSTNTTKAESPTGAESGVATVVIPETTGTSTGTAVATATTTGTETPAGTPTSTGTHASDKSSHTAAWTPDDPRSQGTAQASPSRCANGLVCVPRPASLGGAPAAPSPYGACAAEPKEPADSTGFPAMARMTFSAETTADERKKDPGACCYQWIRPCKGGRPLRGGEGEILAGSTRRSDWLSAIGDIDVASVPLAERAAAAAHFAREAAFEHASIAAFARAAMGLLAMGAPAGLVADTHAAAIDEVEHARITFALASAFGGEARGPSRLDVSGQAPLPASLADLAVETFVDACVGEAAAALALREGAAGARLPVIASLLDRIAEDEERHAELAWRTVAWALREGGAPVREALSAAMESVGEEAFAARAARFSSRWDRERPQTPALRDSRSARSADGELDLRGLGIPGDGAVASVKARAIREVVLPCAAALLAAGERGVQRTTPEALSLG